MIKIYYIDCLPMTTLTEIKALLKESVKLSFPLIHIPQLSFLPPLLHQESPLVTALPPAPQWRPLPPQQEQTSIMEISAPSVFSYGGDTTGATVEVNLTMGASITSTMATTMASLATYAFLITSTATAPCNITAASLAACWHHSSSCPHHLWL